METGLCPACGEENPARFKLCGYCGTAPAAVPEVVLCPACGEENPAKFRLCGYRGTSLGTDPLAGDLVARWRQVRGTGRMG